MVLQQVEVVVLKYACLKHLLVVLLLGKDNARGAFIPAKERTLLGITAHCLCSVDERTLHGLSQVSHRFGLSLHAVVSGSRLYLTVLALRVWVGQIHGFAADDVLRLLDNHNRFAVILIVERPHRGILFNEGEDVWVGRVLTVVLTLSDRDHQRLSDG